ncbi:hypothetical protein AAZX31_08G342500 [Glycine max]|nr:hypothetical protein GYH30_023196 [Glycine max]
MIQVRPTPIQLCYAQASQALQVQPNFTQHVPYSHSWPNQIHPPLPINCLLESLFGGLESENTCSRYRLFLGFLMFLFFIVYVCALFACFVLGLILIIVCTACALEDSCTIN